MRKLISVKAPGPTALSAIPAPALTAVAGSTTVALTATYTGPPAFSTFTFYQIVNNSWTTLATQASGSFNVTGLTSGVLVYFGVVANVAGARASARTIVSTTPHVSVPAQVTGLTVTSTTSSTVSLSWTAATNATTYTVQRNGTVIATGVSGTTFTDTGLASSSTFTYNVAGVNVAGTGAFSTGVVGTTQASSGTNALLAFINGLPAKQAAGQRYLLEGQHLQYFDPNPLGNWTPIQSSTGQLPAIMGLAASNGSGGVPFSPNSDPSSGFYAPIMANNALTAGNIVMLNFWFGNPTAGVMFNGDATNVINPDNDLAQMLVNGTTQHTNWTNCKNQLITMLRSISGTVIVRPFFEMDIGAWWWGNATNAANYINVWKDMVSTVRAAVSNALFFWCSNGAGFQYWPGPAFVDIGGFDGYPPPASAPPLYGQITSLGVAFMIGESGVVQAVPQPATFSGDNSVILSNVMSGMAKCVGLIVFCQNWSLISQNGEAAFMANSKALRLSDLPAGI